MTTSVPYHGASVNRVAVAPAKVAHLKYKLPSKHDPQRRYVLDPDRDCEQAISFLADLRAVSLSCFLAADSFRCKRLVYAYPGFSIEMVQVGGANRLRHTFHKLEEADETTSISSRNVRSVSNPIRTQRILETRVESHGSHCGCWRRSDQVLSRRLWRRSLHSRLQVGVPQQ
jgi:hypothetical protein